ncbi:MAG TPA: hypothetical protein VG056_02010 [Pirellulales bacterium]|jgi:hypothetical protein|nr:hypothetical protein [Pirellulales bacterium]
MKVHVESIFDCPPEMAWAEVQTPRLLLEVIRPLIRFVPPRGTQFPAVVKVGQTISARTYVLSFLPFGLHSIFVERVDSERREIQSRERDRWIRRWDHLISVRETENGRTRYSDEIEIQAGALTPLVWLFAQVFYRHRQRRWRRVVQRLMGK